MLYDLGGMPVRNPGAARARAGRLTRGGAQPKTVPQVNFADTFQNATRAALWAAAASNGGSNAIFSATCLTHCLTDETATLQATKANGVSAQGALGAWLVNAFAPATAVGSASAQVVDVSACIGYPCVAACPGGSTIMNIAAATAAYAQITGSSQSDSSETSGNDSPAAQLLEQQQQQQQQLQLAEAASPGGAQANPAISWMDLGR
jgi:hypothetical protein